MAREMLPALLVLQILLIALCISGEQVLVTCGSLIKLQHEQTKGLLHSHEIPYGSGSGQQSVTGNFETNDANSLWMIKPAKDQSCPQGSPVKKGTAIRLQHAATRRWLHSHHFASPITNNQEVSAFGDDEHSDEGDVWKVQWDKGGALWLKDTRVSFRHVATSVYLVTHAKKYGRPIAGQQEVCGKSQVDYWQATEGVYFPERS